MLADYAQGTDKLQHGYCPLYERHIDPNAIKVLVEIGVYQGGSLKMWDKWLGRQAKIIGFDVQWWDHYIGFDTRTEFRHEDATKATPFPCDVLIDDGSHLAHEQIAAFRNWWPAVRSGGWYVIEDLATMQQPDDYGEGLQEALHAWVEATIFGVGFSELHAYKEIVFLRKA